MNKLPNHFCELQEPRMFYSPDLPSGRASAPPVQLPQQSTPHPAPSSPHPISPPPQPQQHQLPAHSASVATATIPTPPSTAIPQTSTVIIQHAAPNAAPNTAPTNATSVYNANSTNQNKHGSVSPKPISLPSHTDLVNASPDEYSKMIREIHDEFIGGDAEEYHELQIALPRPLQGLRITQVMSRLEQMNPTLTDAAWSHVTADILGNNLVMASVGPHGLQQLQSLKELKLEHGKSTPLPAPQRPNNLYYIEMLLPYEIEMHRPLLGTLLRKFKNVSHLLNPGRKAFGSNRRVRLYFKSITAPREVFTEEDDTIPIREIVLPCGTAAQIVHKWQRLNSFAPPHLAGRWLGRNGRRSYAAATRTTNPAYTTNNAQMRQQRSHPHNSPQPRPGEVAAGPPTHTDAPPSTKPQQPNNNNDNDEMDTSVMPTVTTDAHQMETDTTTTQPTNTIDEAAITQPKSSSLNHNSDNNNNNTQNSTINVSSKLNNNTSNNNNDDGDNSHTHHDPDHQMVEMMTVYTRRNNTSNVTNKTLAPMEETPTVKTRDNKRTADWQTVTNNKAAKKPNTQASTPNIKRATNMFAILATQPLDAFEDDELIPVAVSAPGENNRPAYRSIKTRKSKTNALVQSMRTTQQVRHPHNTLKHLPPNRAQFTLASTDPELVQGRKRLIYQIALLRLARAKKNTPNKKMSSTDDNIYFDECCNLLKEHGLNPQVPREVRAETIVLHLHKLDQERTRKAYHMAKMDLLTRAYLPHLYEVSPRLVNWHGIDITWSNSPDQVTPCMDDRTLIDIACSDTLQAVWAHASHLSPETKRTLDHIREEREVQLNYGA